MNTMESFIVENWETLLVPISSIVTYLFVKRKYQQRELAQKDAELTGANLGNVTANFEVYQNLINDLENRFKARIEDLEADLEKMKAINEDLRKAVSRQERYINKLLIKIDGYENPNK